VLARLAHRLRPGAPVFASDLGRRMSVLDWSQYLVRDSLRARGLRYTLDLYRQTATARRENRTIARCQESGRYWRHDLASFRAAFVRNGFEVLAADDREYRGYNDTLEARRLPAGAGGERA
jgi:hypothetical protein